MGTQTPNQIVARILVDQLVDHGAYEYRPDTRFEGDEGRVYLGKSRQDVYTPRLAAAVLDALAANGYAVIPGVEMHQRLTSAVGAVYGNTGTSPVLVAIRSAMDLLDAARAVSLPHIETPTEEPG